MTAYPLAAGAYRYRTLALAQPLLRGWDVWALQGCLLFSPAEQDGIFGPHTAEAVRSWQARRGLVADGKAGPATQREVILSRVWPIQQEFNTPPGLLRGLVEGESAFLIGNHTAPYPNGTRDVGVTMRNVEPTVGMLTDAFDVGASVARLGWDLRARKNATVRDLGSNERAWKYGAVLYWNWQAASAAYVRGDEDTWRYTSRGHEYGMDDPAPWINEIGVAGVHTGRQWVEHYIGSKTLYVTSWTA